MNNSLVYRSGDLWFTGKVKEFLDTVVIGNYNTIYLNRWSFMHFLSGFLVGKILLKLNYNSKLKYYSYGLVIHTLWEIWQISIGMTQSHKQLFGKGGFSDFVIDTLMFLTGMFLIQLFN